MHPKKWLEQGCHWATWLLSARWKRAFRNSNTEKIENIEFKRGINSGIRERQSKRILIFPHDELLQCFFCEISNTKSFPLIVHLRGASGFAESPQGDWAQIFPTTVVIAGESEEQPDTRGPSPKWFAFSLPREAILFSVDSTTQAMTPLGKCPGPSLQPMGTLTPVAHNLPNTPMARAFIYQCVVSVRGSIPPGGIWKSGGGGCLWSPSSYGY